MNSTQTTLISVLSTLSTPQLSQLTHFLSSLFNRHSRRLSSLLSSPILFSLVLRHLQSLSLHQKSLLIAQHLLSHLTLLNHFTKTTATPPPYMKLKDLDAALLLLLLCELNQHDHKFMEEPISRWRLILSDYYVTNSILGLSTYAGCFSCSEILIQYIESVGRYRNFVNVMGEGKEAAAASAAVVVALPSVEGGGGVECVICKDEMKGGREVCELPCRHLFHWVCILRWFKKRNTCPCCRYGLPTEDVRREIDRLMEDFAMINGGD